VALDDKSKEPASLELAKSGVHETSRKALERVGSEFDHWSGKLTETSLQMCYALIGANWVVFGSVGGILNSGWAKLSLLMVMLTLSSNLIGSWWASEAHRKQFEYAEENPTRWESEFEEAKGKRTAWPFSDNMESVGRGMRRIKVSFPLIGGLLLVIGAVCK